MSTPPDSNPPPKGQFLLYQTDDGQLKIDVRMEGETAWLTQAHMAELFQTTIPNISMHLRNVYAEGELQAVATVKEFLIVRPEGKRQVTRAVEHYNLDAIISFGYCVKSAVATRFRIWATQKLREFIVKGFVLDDERLKNPDQPFDYFEELLPNPNGNLCKNPVAAVCDRRQRMNLPAKFGGRRPPLQPKTNFAEISFRVVEVWFTVSQGSRCLATLSWMTESRWDSRTVAPLSTQIATIGLKIQNLRRTRDLLLPRLLLGQVELKIN